MSHDRRTVQATAQNQNSVRTAGPWMGLVARLQQLAVRGRSSECFRWVMSIANLMMWIGIGLPLSLLAAFFVYPFEADGPERGIVAIWAFSITYIAVLIWGARLSLGVLLTEPSPPSFATKPVWTGRDDDQ